MGNKKTQSLNNHVPQILKNTAILSHVDSGDLHKQIKRASISMKRRYGPVVSVSPA
jgi:hypothetical protein